MKHFDNRRTEIEESKDKDSDITKGFKSLIDDELFFAEKNSYPYRELQTKVIVPNVPPEKRNDIKTLKKAMTIHIRDGNDVISSDSSSDFCADSDRQDMHSAKN